LDNSGMPGTYKDPGQHQLAKVGRSPTGGQLLPGMYAYVKVIIERPGVRAVPASALAYSGDQAFYWAYEHGHAARTEVQTGVSDGEWIEVTRRRVPASLGASTTGEVRWAPIDGSEQVILGDPSLLTDGAPVQVAPATGDSKLTTQAPAADHRPAATATGPVETSDAAIGKAPSGM